MFAVIGVRGRIGLALVGIVAVYLATRLSFMGRFPYLFDEGTYADYTYRAAHSLHDLFISYTIGREPLFIWLGIPLVKLGAGPLTVVRLVSLSCGLATVAVVGLLGRRLGGNAVGLVAAALCVVLPFFVVGDGIGVMESLVTLVMAAALYLQIELARRPDLRLAALLGLVSAAAILTKENTKPAFILLPLSLLCFDWSARRRRTRLRLWLVGAGIVAAMAGAAELVLHASSRYPQLQAARATPFYTVRPLHDVLSDPFGSWGKAWSAYRPAFFQYVSIPLLAAAGAGALLAWRRRPRLTALLLAWIALPFLISMSFASLPFPRHVMYLLPPAIALMAYALVAGGRWAQARLPQPAAALACAAAAVLLLLPALRLDWRVLAHPATARYPGLDDHYVTGTAGGGPWPAVADAIRRRARGPRVVILHPTAYPQTLWYLLGHNPRYVFVRGSSPLARGAQFGLTDELPFSTDPKGLALLRERRFALVRRFPRPRGGAVVKLYERRR